ncbi:T9SS type A sorting domain-containing protein [Polaribacter glomeratus]|uniref:Secretion system C-terminal sorting domain-containing protein n=1 Tax=Polaribacter glomeratus TaxID=102 RepID=A0A2S7WG67_9FLAO|nr:T9SS type A sorting domain-containing protein [Polaribacter glomeratus]PQJ76603.1 hypothetical protein BTO16_11970 [Polaribacter glomeratus]TXD67558.1 T9SS type A sorting domain-containing protein [Polaribacter glomeratus]
MKTKLHKALFIGALALLGAQTSQAQGDNVYLGEPFGGTAIKIGATGVVGSVTRMELENFDSLPGFPDSFNIGANMSSEAFGTYWDKSVAAGAVPGNNSGNDVAGTYRPAGDVDVAEITYEDTSTGYVITGNQGGEYTLQTVEVVTAGTYHLNLNFKSFGAGKRYEITLYSPATLTPVKQLFVATSADAIDGTLLSTNIADDGGYIYRDSQNSKPFTLEVGTWIVYARTLDGGPTFDYIKFTFDSTATASVDDEQVLGSKLSAYPNPSAGGVFNLNKESNWEVYNVLGVKVLRGEGTSVNLSQFAKGVYILKTPHATKRLITN